jgi:CheY-like chemotaxis protein
MKRLLLVEDQAKDLMTAANVAESLGIGHVEACKTVDKARLSLEKGMSGDGSLPDGIVLDLDLGMESGFELLRYWRATPALARIPVMIWSVVEEQREVCELFRVNSFVSKCDGTGAFRQALEQLIDASTAN